MMPVINELTPHLHLISTTARDLALTGSPAELRLALIILDGAAESLLRFNTTCHEEFLRLNGRLKELHAHLEGEGVELGAQFHTITFPIETTNERLPDGTYPVLSATQRKKLREFGPNADLAVFFGEITAEDGAALRSLHHYRNRAYHHNEAHDSTLGALVQVQLAVVARLAGGIRPLSYEKIASSGGFVYPTLPEIVEILEGGPAADPNSVPLALRASLEAQLAAFERGIEEVLRFLPGGILTRDDLILAIQLPEPWPGLEEIRAATVKVTPQMVDGWQAAAAALSEPSSPEATVAKYFAVEAALADLRNDLEPILDQVDQAIDQRTNELRGR